MLSDFASIFDRLTDDQLTEIVASFDDEEDYNDPEDWPAWTDERWEPGPEPEAEEPEPYQPTDADWADYRQWSEALERRRDYEEAMAWLDCVEAREDADRYTDRDLEAAGLPVG